MRAYIYRRFGGETELRKFRGGGGWVRSHPSHPPWLRHCPRDRRNWDRSKNNGERETVREQATVGADGRNIWKLKHKGECIGKESLMTWRRDEKVARHACVTLPMLPGEAE